MTQIGISEFIDQEAVDKTAKKYDLHYDPNLVDKPEELKTLVENAHALIVRNRT